MKSLFFTLSILSTSLVTAQTLTVDINQVTPHGIAEKIGTVELQNTPYGVLFKPNLSKLTPGIHGFHIHTYPNCGNTASNGKTGAALAAGGHYDPYQTNQHGSPWDDKGHLGELPPLYVNNDGTSTTPVVAPRIPSIDIIKGRAIIVHEKGDNFSDHPAPLGGGAGRVACGIIASN